MKGKLILGIESSCDDTSAAVVKDGYVLANVVFNQLQHSVYGGVVPEIASRTHDKNIIPTIEKAIEQANIKIKDIDLVAVTTHPGLPGSLIVGETFSKSLAMALNVPIYEANHINGHIFSIFLKDKYVNNPAPEFPFLSLIVSGGHTQIFQVNSFKEQVLLSTTIDDAAGECFDKCAKVMNLEYPGGPIIDKLAKEENIYKYKFTKPMEAKQNFSFSGLKTAFLYFVQKEQLKNSKFIEENINDLAASLQHTIVEILLDKLKLVAEQTKITQIAISGGVAANSYLRNELIKLAEKEKWQAFVPPIKYTTDNAAMIAILPYLESID